MARIFDLDAVRSEISKVLARSVQSGNVNFLLGSGASLPALPIAGTTEEEIARLFACGKEEEARLKLYRFLVQIQEPTNKLICDESDINNSATLKYYSEFLGILEIILSERRTTLLPKQATIFTTNYDLFVEKASIGYPSLRLNDGFSRAPSLVNRMEYSPRNFFNTTYNTGNLYSYKVEIPCANLIKLHGSLSWKRSNDDILFSVTQKSPLPEEMNDEQIRDFIEDYAVVLPQTSKLRTAIMDRTYYELLRIFANELDRENSLLIVFGFSFCDEHILDITRRALKNPTLRLVVFGFDEAAASTYSQKFSGHNNVDIVALKQGRLDFSKFNETMRGFLPKVVGS